MDGGELGADEKNLRALDSWQWPAGGYESAHPMFCCRARKIDSIDSNDFPATMLVSALWSATDDQELKIDRHFALKPEKAEKLRAAMTRFPPPSCCGAIKSIAEQRLN